ARAAARGLARQRALRQRWRAPSEDGRASRWTLATSLTAATGFAGSTTLIFSVPIIDAASFAVESHAVGVRISGPGLERRFSPAFVEAVGRIAAQGLAPRARRLARRLRRALDLDVARERRFGAHFNILCSAAEAQPGLFDHRERRALEADRHAIEAVQDAVESHVSDLRRACEIELGQPTLMLAFVSRP